MHLAKKCFVTLLSFGNFVFTAVFLASINSFLHRQKYISIILEAIQKTSSFHCSTIKFSVRQHLTLPAVNTFPLCIEGMRLQHVNHVRVSNIGSTW